MKRIFPLLALLVLPALSGCGLHPLYAGGSSGAVAGGLGNVTVDPIEGKAGWLIHNALSDRLKPIAGGQGPAYRLHVELDDQITGFGVRTDDAVTRERRTLRARYQLFDMATGTVVMDATAGSDAGIDVASSEYATIAAEDTALERLAEIIADKILVRIAQKVAVGQNASAASP